MENPLSRLAIRGCHDGRASSLAWGAAAITAETAGTDEIPGVRSPDGRRAKRKQKPRSCDRSQDGATIADSRLPIINKRNRNIARACQRVNRPLLENSQKPYHR